MSSPRIPAVKSQLRQLDSEAVGNWHVRRVNVAARRKLKRSHRLYAGRRRSPAAGAGEYLVDQAVSNKEQAIQFLCGNLGLTGVLNIRSSWKRMSGSGKNCYHRRWFWRSDPAHQISVDRHSSISIARLVKPVDWQSEMAKSNW